MPDVNLVYNGSTNINLQISTQDTIHFTMSGGGGGSATITNADVVNALGYTPLETETDPVFTAWDKSTGISVTESQISDLQTYLTEVALADLTDVDFTDTPTKDEVLKFNGSVWVAAAYNYSFALSISNFTCDAGTTTVLIGTSASLWKNVVFTVAYLNPPPASAHVDIAGTGGISGNTDMNSPTFTTNATAKAVNYPSGKDTTITFIATAMDGATPVYSSTLTYTFRNNIFYGVTTVTSGHTEAQIEALTTVLTNAYTGSFTINCVSNNYLIIAFPSTYTSYHTTGCLFNGVTCPMTLLTSTLSITNTAGKQETYKVYRSTNHSLGNSTLTASTSSNLTNFIYWGVTSSATPTESDIESLSGGSSAASNTKGRAFTITAGSGQYYVYALPARLTAVTLWIGGIDQTGAFNLTTVNITNVNGYAEDYYVYTSINSNLGISTITAV